MKPAENSSPFFIVGTQRSGTTLLRLMLNAHSKICIPFETDFLTVKRTLGIDNHKLSLSQVEKVITALRSEPLTKKSGILDNYQFNSEKPTNFSLLFKSIVASYAHQQGKKVWGIKTPGYEYHIDELTDLYPEARFIHLVRDGRAVALSTSNVRWGRKNIITNAVNWERGNILARKNGNLIKHKYLLVKYEELVTSTEETLAKICAFLGLNFDKNILDYHESANSEMPASSIQWHKSSVSAVNPNKINDWKTKLTKSEKIIFQEVAKAGLEEFGYEFLPTDPHYKTKLLKAFYSVQHFRGY